MADPLDGYMFFVGDGAYKDHNRKPKSIGPVKGETPDARFHAKGAFQIWYFKWDTKHDDNSGPNRKAPKLNVGAFRVKKEIDIATPTLFLANARSAVFPACHVYFRKSGGAKAFTFFHAIFSDCIVEKWEINLEGEEAKEELTVNFNWCELNYYPQTHEGGRKKGDPANVKQFCTSNPESEDVPRLFKKKSQGGDVEEGDMSFLYGG